MIVLGIDTSCDDTSISLLDFKNRKIEILSNVVSSQVKLHQKYGGVYPTLAKREHEKNLPLVLKKALVKKPDAIALTIGPGLDPCLWTGINFAKELAKKWKIPIIPVNHIEAHILINFLGQGKFREIKLPAMCLVVSGGHTQLILMKKIGSYKIIGETRDDAAGECFDKTARILGLPYPGGPSISSMAERTETKEEIKLPRPMIYSKDYDFSFSGLKTSVLYNYKKQKRNIPAMAKEIQQAIIDVLIKKTIRATEEYKAKSIILGGGVSANKELQKQFKKKAKGFDLYIPEAKFCTDNAVMIALTGYLNKRKPIKNITSKPNLRIS